MISVVEENENDTGNNYRSSGKRSVQHNKRFGEEKKKMRLIDADKLRKDIQFVLDTLGEPTKYGLRQAMSIIDKTPTVVDAERHGYWRKVDDKEPLAWDCSVCGAMCHYNTPYCPICGAKMDEVEE